MEFYGKKILLNMVYYTLIALLVAVGITFMVFLGTSDIALYSKIGYFILASLFILLVIFDIICTCLNQMKFVSGIILYVLTVATIVMSTESLFAAVGGAALLGETMSMRGYLGCAIMFIGIIVSQLEIKNKKQKALDV